MDRQEFNIKVAEYMGYAVIYQTKIPRRHPWIWVYDGNCERQYDPHDDMNQLAEVVEKCFKELDINTKRGTLLTLVWAKLIRQATDSEISIKQALRDFITTCLYKA